MNETQTADTATETPTSTTDQDATTAVVDNQPQDGVQVAAVDLPEVKAAQVKAPMGQLDLLLDANMSVSVCMGQAQIQVRDLLQAGPGTVLKLDKQVGEPVDLFLRGKRFALGYLVVVGEQLGVRLKEILPPEKQG